MSKRIVGLVFGGLALVLASTPAANAQMFYRPHPCPDGRWVVGPCFGWGHRYWHEHERFFGHPAVRRDEERHEHHHWYR